MEVFEEKGIKQSTLKKKHQLRGVSLSECSVLELSVYFNIGSILWFLVPGLPDAPIFTSFPRPLRPGSSLRFPSAACISRNSSDTVSGLSLPGRPRHRGITLSGRAPCHVRVLRTREEEEEARRHTQGRGERTIVHRRKGKRGRR